MLDIAAIMMFALAFTIALSSVTITVAQDNKEKIASQSDQYGKEIENLKMILNERLRKLQG
jgi:Skp family chaperone for outer membrane proteins